MHVGDLPKLSRVRAELAKALTELRPRQRAFVELWWTSGRSGSAAELAGYAWPDKQGSRLRSMARVARAIRLRQEVGRLETIRAIHREDHQERRLDCRKLDQEFAQVDALIADRMGTLSPRRCLASAPDV